MNTPDPIRALRAALTVLVFPLCAVFALAETARDFSVPVGEARETLKKFATQAEVEIAFPSENTLAVRTNAVTGRFSPEAAITALLAGTGLSATRDPKTGAYAVRPESPAPSAPGAYAVRPETPAPSAPRVTPTPAVAADRTSEPDIVLLSPFEVNSEKNSGYAATSAIEGSRTNTLLKDIANPIEMLTQDLLNDLGVTDYHSLADIAGNVTANVAGTDNDDGIQSTVWESSRIVIRGFRIQGGSRNFMKLQSNFNAYNAENIAFSRGPNAVLFGSGSPGGSTNYTTKRPLFHRALNSVQFQFDDNKSQRVSADFNRVLIKDKLAFRLNVMDDAHNGWRKPDSRDLQAVHLTGSLKLTPKTVLTLAYENRKDHRITVTGLMPRDASSTFFANGMPMVTSVPANNRVIIDGVNVLASTRGLNTVNGDIYRLIDGQIVNTRGTATIRTPQLAGTDNYDLILNRGQDDEVIGGPIPHNRAVTGFNVPNFTDNRIFEAFLTHEVTRDFHIEAAFGKSDISIFTGHAVIPQVWIDPNAGPRFGQYYADVPVFSIQRERELSNARVTASYDLDFTETSKWLGRHRLVALAETHSFGEIRDGKRLTRTGTPAGPINPTSFGNDGFRNGTVQLQVRGYLDPANGVFSPPDIGFLRTADTFTSDGFTFTNLRVVPFAQENNLTKEDTLMGILQSHWLNGRLVTSFGYRDDTTTIQRASFVATSTAATAAFPGDGQVRPSELKAGADPSSLDPRDAAFTSKQDSGGISRNAGAVFNVTNWLALTYNQATNHQPNASTGNNIFNQTTGDSAGESQDFGIRLSLMDGKIRIDALRYDTAETATSVRASNVGANLNPFLAIDDILHHFNPTLYPRLYEFAGAFTTTDTRSQGEELSITANPTDQWSFRLTAKAGRAQLSNIAPEIVAIYNAGFAGWSQVAAANPGLLPSSDIDGTSRTLEEQLGFATDAINIIGLREGAEKFPSSEHQVRFTGRYSFSRSGPLKGLAVGGSYNWQSAPVVGYYQLADGSFDLTTPYKGEEDTTLNLFASYKRKLTDKVDWSIQLNVNNVLNDFDPRPVNIRNPVRGVNDNLVVIRHRPVDGRVFQLTTRFDF